MGGDNDQTHAPHSSPSIMGLFHSSHMDFGNYREPYFGKVLTHSRLSNSWFILWSSERDPFLIATVTIRLGVVTMATTFY